MKRFVAVIFGSLLLCAPAVFADEATKKGKIEELIKLTSGDKLVNQMFDQIKNVELAQLSKMDVPAENRERVQQVQQRIIQLLQDRLSWDNMKPMLIRIYADTFTEEEVDGILNFYKTPAGQAMLQKMPMLMQRSMAMSQQMLGDVTPEIQKIMKDMKAQESHGAAAAPAPSGPPH